MKKIIFGFLFPLLFFTEAYAKVFKVHVKHYKSHESYFGTSKKNFEEAEKEALKKCKTDVYLTLRQDGCLIYALQSYTALETLTGKEYEQLFWGLNVANYEAKLRFEEGQKRKEEEKKRIAQNKFKKEKEKELLLKKLANKFGSKCETGIFNPKGFEKNSKDYNNCLIEKYNEQQQLILAKQKRAEEIKLAKQKEAERLKIAEAEKIKKEKQLLKNMGPEERSSYKCENTYGFRKGTSKFKECLFKMYQAEIELEKLKIQNENQKQKLALEREKLKASQAQTEAANAQAAAAREQAEAAKRNAEANESRAATADYERRREMREKGLRSLSGECSLLKGNC